MRRASTSPPANSASTSPPANSASTSPPANRVVRTRTSQKSLEADLYLYRLDSQKDELTPIEYEIVLEKLLNELGYNEYIQVKEKLDSTLKSNAIFNNKLSLKYNNEKYYSVFILFAFIVVLPILMNATIPINIALFVKLSLNFFNLQLLNYYYRIFVDPYNDEITNLRSGEPLRLTNEFNLRLLAYEFSPNAKKFENTAYIIMNGLMKIKQEVNEFSKELIKDKQTHLRFVYFYLAIFIVMLYFAICFDRDELKNMIPPRSRQTTTQLLLNQASKILNLSSSGGKKVKKPKISTKPKKKTIA